MTSNNLYGTRGLLLASGLLATGIAAMIFVVPDNFYASYGIDISANASLANELKAPAGTLLAAGLIMLFGVVKLEYTVTSLAVASLVYLSYGLSRLVSTAVDGVPNSALLSAAMLELVIGALCLFGFFHVRMNARFASIDRRREESA